MPLLGVALSSVLALSSAPALAQDAARRAPTPEQTADLQCMAIFSALASQDDMAEAGAIGVFYYLGRLEGRDPAVDWLSRFTTSS